MPPYLGFGAALGVGIESTWGTSVARSLWFPLAGESLSRTVEKSPRNTLAASSGGRTSRKHFRSADNVGGMVSLLLTYEGWGVFWKHLLGAAATTGPVSSLYTHVYSQAMNTLPGLTLESVRGTGTAEVFSGMKATKATVKIEAGKEVTASIDFIGKTSGGRVSAATPSFATSRDTVALFDQAGTANWNSVSYSTTGMEITFDQKLTRRPQVGSLLTSEPMPSGFIDIKIRLDLEWSEDTLDAALTADTEGGPLSVTFTDSSSRTITFDLANCYVESASAPISGVGIIKQTVVLKAQAASGNEGLKVTVVNTQATALTA